MTREEIISKLKKSKSILESYGIRKIGLFGSYAEQKQNEESDIDILIEIHGKNMYKNYCRAKYYLEDLLGEKIDLLTINNLEEKYETLIAKKQKEKVKKEVLEKTIYV